MDCMSWLIKVERLLPALDFDVISDPIVDVVAFDLLMVDFTSLTFAIHCLRASSRRIQSTINMRTPCQGYQHC